MKMSQPPLSSGAMLARRDTTPPQLLTAGWALTPIVLSQPTMSWAALFMKS